MQFIKAKKEGLKIRVAIIGPSGSGKTYSALRLATGIGGRVGLLDTENGRGKYYADEFDFDYIQLSPPFKPERYMKIIELAKKEGIDTLIIDSASHEWGGTGGILDEHGAMAGNSYTNWNKLTPRHNAFIDMIIQSPINIIATLRGKDEYVLSEKNGKQIPEKIGLGAVMRDGFEYEMTCSFMLNLTSHTSEVMKDNTHLFTGCEMLTEEHGHKLKEWAEGGVDSFIIEMNNFCKDNNIKTKEALEYAKIKSWLHCPVDKRENLKKFILTNLKQNPIDNNDLAELKEELTK